MIIELYLDGQNYGINQSIDNSKKNIIYSRILEFTLTKNTFWHFYKYSRVKWGKS